MADCSRFMSASMSASSVKSTTAASLSEGAGEIIEKGTGATWKLEAADCDDCAADWEGGVGGKGGKDEDCANVGCIGRPPPATFQLPYGL